MKRTGDRAGISVINLKFRMFICLHIYLYSLVRYLIVNFASANNILLPS